MIVTTANESDKHMCLETTDLAHRNRYRDQNETTAKTWIFLNWTEGRPSTWSRSCSQTKTPTVQEELHTYHISLQGE